MSLHGTDRSTTDNSLMHAMMKDAKIHELKYVEIELLKGLKYVERMLKIVETMMLTDLEIKLVNVEIKLLKDVEIVLKDIEILMMKNVEIMLRDRSHLR